MLGPVNHPANKQAEILCKQLNIYIYILYKYIGMYVYNVILLRQERRKVKEYEIFS